MKTRTFIFTAAAAILAGLLALGGSVNAAPGGNPGGGPPTDGGGGTPPVDYGDLIKLYRNASGVPYLTLETTATDPETGLPVPAGLCQQPLYFASDACPTDCVRASVPTGADVVAVDQITCAVAAACTGCTQEVDFGRMSVSRSSDAVFTSQLDDVIVNLATADCVSLDPAGRLVTSTVADDGTVTSGAIDSPLQNLAIYKQLMTTGYLGAAPGLPLPDDVLNTAARGLGAAADKGGKVNVDLVVYLNQILGLTEPGVAMAPELGDLICQQNREEVSGQVQLVTKCFLNYGGYAYDRSSNFGALPDPAYIPADGPKDGWFEYLALVPETSDPFFFKIEQGSIMDAAFCVEGGLPVLPVDGVCTAPALIEDFTASNIGGFAQAADDARAVINFMHNWPVPNAEVYATPLLCEASGGIFYDLSISAQSGLQVPVNYVKGTAREFTVAVGNAGPDAANGTVTVTASCTGCPPAWNYAIVDLPAGQSVSFVQPFTINTTSSSIAWTATVVASGPGTDPNPSNNSVTATSTVKATGRP